MNKKGFTLIEVLVGLVLLAIGLLAIASMQVTSVRGNFFSNYLTQASYAGQERLEFLDGLLYTSAELSAGSHTDPSTTLSGIEFKRSYTVAAGDPKVITYTVSWKDGVDRNIVFWTIRSQ